MDRRNVCGTRAYNDDLGGSTSTDDQPWDWGGPLGVANPEYGGGGDVKLSHCIHMDYSKASGHNTCLVAP